MGVLRVERKEKVEGQSRRREQARWSGGIGA